MSLASPQAPGTAADAGGTITDWRAWLDDLQGRHAEPGDAVRSVLRAQAPALPADALGAEALRLAEHVWLGHAADAAGLQGFVDALPPAFARAEATAPSLQRARWAMAVLAGLPAPAPATDAIRWRALQNVVLAMGWRGRAAEAFDLLCADEAAAAAHGKAEAGVAYASSANNVAGHLQDSAGQDAGRDALMLQAAALARRAWTHAGNWMHVERADYRLALCHAAAGQGAEAVVHAQRCLAGCEAAGEQADAVEHYFAHEALVRAHRAAGTIGQADASLQRMQALLPTIAEADGLRAWCADVLAGLNA